MRNHTTPYNLPIFGIFILLFMTFSCENCNKDKNTSRGDKAIPPITNEMIKAAENLEVYSIKTTFFA